MRSFTQLLAILVLISGSTLVARAQPSEPPPDDGTYPDDEGYPAPEPAPAPMPAPAPAPTQPPPGYAQPQPPPPPAGPVSTIDQGVYNDANIGRSWLSPTALTPPRGTWSFSDYELFFVGGSYAFTDQFQISANTMVPITSDQPLIILMTAKLQVAKINKLRLALHGTFNHVGESGDDGTNFYTGTIGGVASLCLDNDCDSLLNGYLAAGFGSESDGSVIPFVFSGSLLKKLSRRVKIAVEIDSAFIVGEIDDMANAFLGWYGLRFTSKNIGVDVGFARPFGPDVDWDVFPLGFPVVSFTYRDGL